MYAVDSQDFLQHLTDVPLPNVGAPLPTLAAADGRLVLAYLVNEPDPNWDGTYVNVVSPSDTNELVALLVFQHPYAHMFGPPNDEAFKGHPLAGRGLVPYKLWEVNKSSWVRCLEKMNAVHPYHKPSLFAGYRHFIFGFHDTSFECIAKSYTISVHRGSINDNIREAFFKGAA